MYITFSELFFINLSFNTLDFVNNSTSTLYTFFMNLEIHFIFFHWICILDQRDLVFISIFTGNTLVFDKLFELLTNYILFGLWFLNLEDF